MATMYPRAPFGAKSHGEVELFQALEQGLDDTYHVFYSVAWLAPRRPGLEPSDGESDFVILHPDLGLLTIEVKGGQISYDPHDGWYTQPFGAAHNESIRDPFQQAKDNKYSLRRKLQTLPGWRNRFIRDGHAVAFTDGVAPTYPPRPDAQPSIMLSALDLPHIARRIEDIYDFWAGEDEHDRFGSFRPAEMTRIIDVLGRRWDLRAPRLNERLAIEAERIVHLTERQYSLLGFLGEQRRASIAGPAGSGKTMIAVEKARRLADEGFRTLLMCYNRPLADYLRTVVPAQPNLFINSFHRFCGEFTHGHLDSAAEGTVSTASSEEFYRTTLPNALLEAVVELPQDELLDALIIDEGQDFQKEWFEALDLLLSDRGAGVFYVFFDDNQNLYHTNLGRLGLASPFRLSENCRNTKRIYEALQPYYRGTHLITCDGPGGDPVQPATYHTQEELVEQLVTLTANLVFAEDVPTQSIVLLSSHGHERGPLAGIGQLGAFGLIREGKPSNRQLLLTTIHRFKGLERPIVALILSEGDQQEADLLYVGMSRACNRLFVFKPSGMNLSIVK